jgi:phytanoyl-CoA hydroxylase
MMSSVISPDVDEFRAAGFLVVRGLLAPALCAAVRARVEQMLTPLQGPAEFEADVGYPGAPANRLARGGLTPRRLLHAYSRDELLRQVATGADVGRWLAPLLGGRPLLSQSHHNCIMTKYPGHSSSTHWHRDIRYWSFERPELVSGWIALGSERPNNGGLRVLPGSHRLDLAAERYDPAQFLRTDIAANAELIATAVDVQLDAGDMLFFHCRLFHAAGRNETVLPKLSLVFSYHDVSNRPVAGTRSALYPAIPVAIS